MIRTFTEPHLTLVDIYHGDGDIQFHALAAAGVCGVIAKCSQGLHMKDPQYATNRARGYVMRHELGIWNFGAYHFFDPDTDPVAQVETFLANAQVKSGDIRPSLDVETLALGHHLTTLDERASAAAHKLKIETGLYPLLYASESFFTDYQPKTVRLCIPWVARYGPKPHTPGMRMWQYTSSGHIPGIPHVLDMDVFYGTQGDLDALCIK
jgi:lysozyme